MHRSSAAVALALLTVAVVADQLTKAWVRTTFHVGESLHIGGPVNLTYVENAGAVFGIGQGYFVIPTIATVLILIALPLIIRHLKARCGYMLTKLEAACVGLIAGGAVGNLIDRLTRSAVTDFVDIELFPDFHWPAFNVADSCVVVATIMLFIVLVRHGSHEVEHHATS
ncbi:MAG: signal peptidase II [Dehalococcoidia bacterium]|nr:signal peptidase II [Dehalococcoidia bacterium]